MYILNYIYSIIIAVFSLSGIFGFVILGIYLMKKMGKEFPKAPKAVEEKVTYEPKAEEVKEEPKAEEVKEEPKAEEVKEEPKAEEVKEEPKAEEVKEEPEVKKTVKKEKVTNKK